VIVLLGGTRMDRWAVQITAELDALRALSADNSLPWL